MAQSQNTHNKDIFDGTLVCATDQTGVKVVNQGDVVTFDKTLNSSQGGVRTITAQADMASGGNVGFLGVAMANSILNSLNDVLLTIEVGFKNVFNFKTTSGETYYHLTKVYSAVDVADAQTVTTSTNSGGRTVPVGYVVLPNEYIMNGVLSVTGAAGVLIPVAITPNIPAAYGVLA